MGCRVIAKKGKKRKVHRTLQQKIVFGLAVYLVLLAAAGAAYLAWRLAAPPPAGSGPAQRLDAALLDELMKEVAAAKESTPAPPPTPFYPLPGTAVIPPGPGAPSAQAAPQGAGATAAPFGGTALPAPVDLPPGQLAELQKKVSAADRLKAMSIVLRRLSSDDLRTLAGLARGGLTAEEKKAAKELLVARLTPQEWAELRAIYEKYK